MLGRRQQLLLLLLLTARNTGEGEEEGKEGRKGGMKVTTR